MAPSRSSQSPELEKLGYKGLAEEGELRARVLKNKACRSLLLMAQP